MTALFMKNGNINYLKLIPLLRKKINSNAEWQGIPRASDSSWKTGFPVVITHLFLV